MGQFPQSQAEEEGRRSRRGSSGQSKEVIRAVSWPWGEETVGGRSLGTTGTGQF